MLTKILMISLAFANGRSEHEPAGDFRHDDEFSKEGGRETSRGANYNPEDPHLKNTPALPPFQLDRQATPSCPPSIRPYHPSNPPSVSKPFVQDIASAPPHVLSREENNVNLSYATIGIQCVQMFLTIMLVGLTACILKSIYKFQNDIDMSIKPRTIPLTTQVPTVIHENML